MANPMDSSEEPSKWVCRLVTDYGEGDPGYGTGFVVNIPDTKKYCIMTAAHNILRIGKDEKSRIYAKSIAVYFPGQPIFTASEGEFFLSAFYDKFPTVKQEVKSSVSDYGLIAVDKSSVQALENWTLSGGCAFSILPEDNDLNHQDCTVYGYKGGEEAQTKTTSKFSFIENEVLHYENGTQQGVSGGPVFINHNKYDIVVGIHNYAKRATRLTYGIILEMLSWIKDYKLVRTFEYIPIPPKPKKRNQKREPRKSRGAGGVYLHATTGLTPKLLARPGLNDYSNFNVVIVSAAKGDAKLPSHRFAIAPANCHHKTDKMFYFITRSRVNGDSSMKAELEAGTGPSVYSSFSLNSAGMAETTELFALVLNTATRPTLAVVPKTRKGCECGCISQDDKIEFKATDGSDFLISPSFKS